MTGSIDDRLAIIDLTIAYCWALDTKDWPALRDVFAADATADLASPMLSGVDEITARIAGALGSLDDSQHLVSNHQVVFDGRDDATCRCYLQAQHVRRGTAGGDNYIIAGRYEDTLVRTAVGWRITHRRLVPMWRDGNVAVVRID